MSLIDVGSPAVLFSTRDKKFVSGLSKSEIYNYSITVSGEVHPWIASLQGTDYLAVGIGRIFRLVKVGFVFGGKAGSHVWLDDSGSLWVLSTTGYMYRIPKSRGWCEFESSQTSIWLDITSDTSGIFQEGNDMMYVKGENSIKGCHFSRETGRLGTLSWETSVSGTFYDFQWCEKENELVIPNYDGNTVTLIEGGKNGGRVLATKDIGHKTGQVAIDKEGRYWFQEWEGNKITVCNPNDLSLASIEINGTTYEGTFEVPFISYSTGISENANFDIIMCDYGSNYVAFFSADDDYSHIIRIYLGENSYVAAPLGDKNSFFLSTLTGLPTGHYRCNLFNPISQVLTPVNIDNHLISGMGDPGLARYKTWGRSWEPDVSAIYDYLFHPATES